MQYLNAKQRKELERVERTLNKMITVRECNEIWQKEKAQTKKQYDIVYTLAMCNALAAEPFNFKRGRLATFLEMFFGQIEGLHSDTIDLNMLADECEKMGVKMQHNGGRLEINVLGAKCN